MDACKEAGVEHLIYSGLENVKEAIGKACHHFDAKAAVEEYIAEKGTYSLFPRRKENKWREIFFS